MKIPEINGRSIGPDGPCFVIAEMGLGHDGSLGMAHAFIDSAAEAGADAVKFQTHIADAESTPAEAFRVRVFPQDETRQDYWRRTAFPEAHWVQLKEHADERGVVFLSSPFSLEAVRLLDGIGVAAWKVASGETSNTPLVEALADTGKPFLVSSGMSTWDEIDRTMSILQKRDVPTVLYQCTNRYPCPPENVGLNLLAAYRDRYDVPVGLSDHSGQVACGIAARTLGACSVEVHVTFSRKCFGPDVPASLTVDELAALVSGIRFVEKALASPVEKDAEAVELQGVRDLFTKSIVTQRPLATGSVLTEDDVAFKKPGTGIPAADVGRVLGKRLCADLPKDALIQESDLSDG